MNQGAKKRADWIIVLSYIFLMYISLPVVPVIWRRFRIFAGNFSNYIAFVILALFGSWMLFYLILQRKDKRSLIWLVILSLVYIFALSRLELPIERIHFIEYGLLGVLIFRALRHKISGSSIYFYSAAIVFGLGLLDEGIQYILPNRVYEIKDVAVNGLAGILALFLVALCFRPQLQCLRCKR